MLHGKRSTAQKIFYEAVEKANSKVEAESIEEIFEKAIENIRPTVEVRSKRVGGADYQVPKQVSKSRQQSLAFRWIMIAMREKKGVGTAKKLADELFAAYNKEGAAMTRRENIHRMADANKAFAHFAW